MDDQKRDTKSDKAGSESLIRPEQSSRVMPSRRNTDAAVVPESPDVQRGSEVTLLKPMRKVVVTKRMKVLQKKFILKELLEILYGIRSAKGKTSEADPNSERSMTIHPSIEETLGLH